LQVTGGFFQGLEMDSLQKDRSELFSEVMRLRKKAAELEARVSAQEPLLERLKLSEAKFRVLVEKSGFGMFVVKDGRLRYANPRMAEIFRYSPAGLKELGRVKPLVLEEDWPEVEKAFNGAGEVSAAGATYRFRGRTKDGEIIYCAAHGCAARLGESNAALFSLLDVTPLVNAQSGLEAELNKFQLLYRLATEMTADQDLGAKLAMVADMSKRLLDVDVAFIAMTDPANGSLTVSASCGFRTDAFAGLTIPSDKGLEAKLSRTLQVCVCEDYMGRAPDSAVRAAALKEGLVSGAAAPVQSGGRSLGVLYAMNRSRRSFTQADTETLALLANLAAVEVAGKQAEKAGRESEERYKSVMEAVPDPIVVFIKGRVTYVNPAFTRVFGWALDELAEEAVAPFAGASAIWEQEVVSGAIPAESVFGFETRRKNKAGDTIDINVSAALLRGSDGEVIGSVIALQDITERKRAERELQKYKDQLEELVRQRTAEAAQLAETNKKLHASVRQQEQRTYELTVLHQMGELLQACRTEEETYKIVGNACSRIFPGDRGFLSIMDETRTTLQITATWGSPQPTGTDISFESCWALRLGKMHCVENPEVELICPHGPHVEWSMSICAPITAQGEVLGMLHLGWDPGHAAADDDESQQTVDSRRMLVIRLVEHYALALVNLRLHNTLTRLSIRDPLTGLYNRRYMEASLEREIKRAKRRGASLGVIMVDVDHFKTFNDVHGHEVGDAILRKLGAFFEKSVRGEDIACRYGGEEFILILPDTGIDDLMRRAETMRTRAKEEVAVVQRGKTLTITLSMGVAVFPEHGASGEETLGAADQALYRAKSEGRDRIVKAADRSDYSGAGIIF
jgi:diguanylate cyclase (GGDEF)-like protein/PAS domain S-box-containing protein